MLVVVDLGLGNIGSITSALRFLGVDHEVTAEPGIVATAEAIVLPGVGSFAAAVHQMDILALRAPLRDHAAAARPLLGVCLGMQILFDSSKEGPGRGLGVLPGDCKQLGDEPETKVPHVGFDTVRYEASSWLGQSLGIAANYYFTHSYAIRDGDSLRDGICAYDGGFVAVVERWPIVGAQFHPEKSQASGLALLRAFLERARVHE